MALTANAFANYGPNADRLIKVGNVYGPSLPEPDGSVVHHVVVSVRREDPDAKSTSVGFFALDTNEALAMAAEEFGWGGAT